MSQDDIVFEEVRYREPERMRRPDRDRRYACLAYELPGFGELPIFLDRRPADAIERHALRDTSVELGGILLGKECRDLDSGEPFVWVTESLEAKHYENTQASFTYTHDSWEEITRQRDQQHPELDIVGWYHTHPDFGIFLSNHDLFIHRHFFAQPLQVAYVVDPVRQTRGFFQWRGEAVAQVGGYFLIAPREERLALARCVNDLESILNSDGGGGALSPRLEAELMAMLTRTNTAAQATSAERTLVATAFSLLGMVAGILIVLAAIWMSQLTRSIQEEHAKIDVMAQSLERSTTTERVALEALLATSKAGEHDPDPFLTQYRTITRERDDAVRKLGQQATINGEIASRLGELDKTNARLKTDIEDAVVLAQKYEKDAKEVATLRKRVAALESENETQARKLDDNEEVVDTLKGRNARALLRSYDRAWYAAVAGWAILLVLALGLATALWLKPLSEPLADAEAPGAGGEARREEPPPHVIT